jgi:uncharacterized repeat protein (TIGR01451 family)
MAIFTNQASLSYRGTVINSNVVTGEVREALGITKTPLSATYSPDGTVTYIINLINSGSTALDNLTLTDDLGAYQLGGNTLVPLTFVEDSVAYFVNGVYAGEPNVVSTSPLVISGLSLPAGANAAVVYQATVNEFAPLGIDGAIVNLATVSGNGVSPVSASATVTASAAPNLDITKALTPTTVDANGEITYTFTIRNYGNTAAVATDNATLTDTFNPVLDISSVNFNGAAWSEGVQYSYDEATGLFATAPSAITVPAATYVQDPNTGAWTVIPGESVLTVVGTI